MLDLLKKQSDHPLGSLRSAQQLLGNLPTDDAAKLLQEISHWAEAAVDPANKFRLDHQLAVLRLLDETAHPYLVKVINDYFSVQPLNTFHSNSLWMAINEYFTHIGYAYLSVLRSYRNDERGSSAIKSDMPLITARGMVAVAGRLKCTAVRYALVDPELWSNLAEFYALAEVRQYLNEPLKLYAESQAISSVQGIFAGALLWQACGAGSLSPLQMHIADRLISFISDYLTIEGAYVASSLLAFDLRHSIPPMRLSGDSTVHPGLRFIGVSEAPQFLDDLIRALEKGSVPEKIKINAAYSAELVLDVARHLARCISATPPLRRNPRRKVSVNLCVANGLSELGELADTRWNSMCEAGESWETEDISANGFLCILRSGRTSKVKIGELIGLQPENVDRWGAGIVRRLSRDAQNNLLIGVEMLSNHVVGVVLRDHLNPGSEVGEMHALYLNKPGDETGEAWLLLKPDTFSSKRSLDMTMDDRRYLLMPLELMRQGEDYDLARYRKMEQDTSANVA